MVLVFPEILVCIQADVFSQSLSLVAAHWIRETSGLGASVPKTLM